MRGELSSRTRQDVCVVKMSEGSPSLLFVYVGGALIVLFVLLFDGLGATLFDTYGVWPFLVGLLCAGALLRVTLRSMRPRIMRLDSGGLYIEHGAIFGEGTHLSKRYAIEQISHFYGEKGSDEHGFDVYTVRVRFANGRERLVCSPGGDGAMHRITAKMNARLDRAFRSADLHLAQGSAPPEHSSVRLLRRSSGHEVLEVQPVAEQRRLALLVGYPIAWALLATGLLYLIVVPLTDWSLVPSSSVLILTAVVLWAARAFKQAVSLHTIERKGSELRVMVSYYGMGSREIWRGRSKSVGVRAEGFVELTTPEFGPFAQIARTLSPYDVEAIRSFLDRDMVKERSPLPSNAVARREDDDEW